MNVRLRRPHALPSAQPDASMELLNGILRDAVDPDYSTEARAAGNSRRAAVAALLAFGVAGFGFAISAIRTTQAAPAAQQERLALIRQIGVLETNVQAQRDQVNQLRTDIGQLQTAVLGADSTLSAQQSGLELRTGLAAVQGAGMVLVIEDSEQGTMIDQDLRQIVNGLWQSDAEAIAINGHRLSSRTAIRSAGEAITVDYRSLRSPYRLEVIGDPRTLASVFGSSDGGVWLSYLHNNFGIRYQTTDASSLTLPADPGLTVERARRLT